MRQMLLTFLIAATASVVLGLRLLFRFSGLEKNPSAYFLVAFFLIAGVKCSQNIVSHLQLETKNVKYSCCSNRLVRKWP